MDNIKDQPTENEQHHEEQAAEVQVAAAEVAADPKAKESNVTVVDYHGKELILIGTAHVSAQSAQEVKAVIERERPDAVCIELDAGRYESISKKNKWQDTDLVKIIKAGKAGMLLVNIILSNYQRRLADQFNIQTGQEMLQGIESAKEVGAELVLADREIQTTFMRIWRGSSAWEKAKLLTSLLMGVLDDEEITEAELEELKSEDVLSAALSEMSEGFGSVKKYLVDERDQYLAYKIKNAPGDKVVAVLGAAHVPGIKEEIFKEQNLAELDSKPQGSKVGKIVGWAIPLALVAIIVATFFHNPEAGFAQTKFWLFLTMAGAGLGALAAGANILSILTAIVAAPISALNPLLAAGWFSGIVEAHVIKPKVSDFENLHKDLFSLKGFWRNKITKVLLVVMLTNVGCAIGNIVGSFNALSIFFTTLFS